MKENVFFDASIMYAVQPPIYDELLHEERTSLAGSKCERTISDCYLLLNQNRLDKQTKEVILEHIENAIGSSGLAELRNKYTDDQLTEFIKSRQIQSKSELHDYMKYLMNKTQQENYEMEYKKLLAEQKKQAITTTEKEKQTSD